MRSVVIRLAVIILVCGSSGACYRYSVTSADRLAPQTEVRARLTPAEADRLRPYLYGDARVLEGRFIAADTARVLLDVPTRSDVRGMRVETLHQRLDVDAAGILELETKELDRTRTALVTGAGVAVVAGAVIAWLGPAWASRSPGDGEPPAELIPLLRLPGLFRR